MDSSTGDDKLQDIPQTPLRPRVPRRQSTRPLWGSWAYLTTLLTLALACVIAQTLVSLNTTLPSALPLADLAIAGASLRNASRTLQSPKLHSSITAAVGPSLNVALAEIVRTQDCINMASSSIGGRLTRSVRGPTSVHWVSGALDQTYHYTTVVVSSISSTKMAFYSAIDEASSKRDEMLSRQRNAGARKWKDMIGQPDDQVRTAEEYGRRQVGLCELEQVVGMLKQGQVSIMHEEQRYARFEADLEEVARLLENLADQGLTWTFGFALAPEHGFLVVREKLERAIQRAIDH
ncbi:hypothetical protein MBLNU459_g6713t1 [Dothideomycetes sp. NU459]